MFRPLLLGSAAFLACAFPAFAAFADEKPAELWRFNTGRARLEIDVAKTGQITRWIVDGKPLVGTGADDKTGEPGAPPASPLSLVTTGEGAATFQALSFQKSPNGVTVKGRLTGSGIETPAEIRYEARDDGAEVAVSVNVARPDLKEGDVREFEWSLPLSLRPRKRIYFRGDHGFDWETRYFYQFTVDSAGYLLPNAERNEWRYFGLDQLGESAFRLWRSESEATSPLMMQQGKAAAPYVQLFDEQGGVAVEYPALAARVPRSLRVDAAQGGRAIVQFWSKAFVPAPADAPHLFEVPHEIVLHGDAGEKAVLATRASLNSRAVSSPEVNPAEVMKEPDWLRTTPLSTAAPSYVTGGYPFAPGELRDLSALRVEAAGTPLAVQAKPLGFWPDGSVKWAQLTFAADPAGAVADCPPPRVSLRDGRFIPVSIKTDGNAPAAPQPAQKLELVQSGAGDSVSIRNGELAIELGTGANWLKNIALQSRPLLGRTAPAGAGTKAGSIRLAYTDYLVGPKHLFPFDRNAEGGKPDPGGWSVDKITVEESGPLRALIRLEGMTGNAEPTRLIVRLELLAGRAEMRITHTAEFRFKDPRKTFLTAMGLEIPFDRAALGATSFANFTEQAVPGEVGGGQLFQASQVQAELELRRKNEWHRVAGTGEAQGWLHSRGESLQVVAAVRNFWQQAPKAVSIGFDRGALRFELWPEASGPMDVRRYSNYPHRAQGESVKPNDNWVETDYYPEEPFVGVSRSNEMLLFLAPAGSDVSAAALAADFQSPPLLYAGWERYASTGVVLPSSTAETWPRAWEAWTRFANFWLYHRELHGWYGTWDFGDVRHLFRRGYGWILPPETLVKFRNEPPASKKRSDRPARAVRKLDYQPANDWAFDNGRWGWTNTEGLPGLFMQQEYLRHGNRAVYFTAESMARHSRDVVTRHEGKWFGRGTRHGVQHWSDGNHEERQTTITEYRLHYFLSGEPRSREVVQKLYEGVYSKTPVNVDAAHSGRLGGLLFHWELTGSPAEAEQLKNYTRLFLSPDGLYVEPSVRFPGPETADPPRKLNDGSMFFHTFGGLHALMEYQQMTRDPAIEASLIKLADSVVSDPALGERYRAGKISGGQIFWPAIAFAARHAENPAPYRRFLQEFLENSGWKLMYQTVTRDPAHWSGETGYLPNGVPMAFFWANWAPYTTGALNTDQVWSPRVASLFEAVEKSGDPLPRKPVSWQSEFDGIAELDDYLGYQQPWKKPAPGPGAAGPKR